MNKNEDKMKVEAKKNKQVRHQCIVFGCEKPERVGEKITYHEFPNDAITSEKWRRIINLEGSRKGSLWSLDGKRHFVCSKHFLHSDFKPLTKRRVLFKHAIPSVFTTYPDHLRPQIFPGIRREIKKTASCKRIFDASPLCKENYNHETASQQQKRPRIEETAQAGAWKLMPVPRPRTRPNSTSTCLQATHGHWVADIPNMETAANNKHSGHADAADCRSIVHPRLTNSETYPSNSTRCFEGLTSVVENDETTTSRTGVEIRYNTKGTDHQDNSPCTMNRFKYTRDKLLALKDHPLTILEQECFDPNNTKNIAAVSIMKEFGRGRGSSGNERTGSATDSINTQRHNLYSSFVHQHNDGVEERRYAETGIQVDQHNLDVCNRKVKKLLKRNNNLQKQNRNLKRRLLREQHYSKKLNDEIKALQNIKKDHLLVNQIKNNAKENDRHSTYLLDLLNNYNLQRPNWSETTIRYCIVWRHTSPCGYEEARRLGLIRAPCLSTLNKYMGDLKGGTGLSDLGKARIRAEVAYLPPIARKATLVIDEAILMPRLVYEKKSGKVKGFASKEPNETDKITENPDLATKVLCFVVYGLSVSYTIPAEYFYIHNLKAEELHELTNLVITDMHECGIDIIRISVDNAKVNAAMFRIFSKSNDIKEFVPHPVNPSLRLYLSFDYVHVLKNVRSQMLAGEMSCSMGVISPSFLLELYYMQKPLTFKPVRNYTKKHVLPSNIEKMNAKRAVDMYKPELISTVKTLLSWGEKTTKVDFRYAGPTIKFMEMISKFFKIHDISDSSQHIRQNDPEKAPFKSSDDERLLWLEFEFIEYIIEVQMFSAKSGRRGLTDETAEALITTCKSTMSFVRYLLDDLGFKYVLTRKLASDCVEGVFGAVRRHNGCNPRVDCRAVDSAMKDILRTGIIMAPKAGNSSTDTSTSSTVNLTKEMSSSCGKTHESSSFPENILCTLKELKCPSATPKVNLESATLAKVGGFLVCCVGEQIKCTECLQTLERPCSMNKLYDLIRNEDRGNLKYPAPQLVSLMLSITNFVKQAFPHCRKNENIAKTMKSVIKPCLVESDLFTCTENFHHEKVADIILTKLLSPTITNIASKVTQDKYPRSERPASLYYTPKEEERDN